MEGTTNADNSVLVGSLDSGLREGVLSLEPLEQSVIDTLLVARPMEGIMETDLPECSALVSQLDYGQSYLESPAWTRLEYGHGEFDITDAMRHEALRIRSTGCVSAVSINGLILPPEEDCLHEKEMSLEYVSSEGLRQWNMDMDVEYQYETFNGLPVYYGGDMYDSQESEDDPLERVRVAYVEDYNFDVPEGMELMAYNQRRPDGGEEWTWWTWSQCVELCHVSRALHGMNLVTHQEQTLLLSMAQT